MLLNAVDKAEAWVIRHTARRFNQKKGCAYLFQSGTSPFFLFLLLANIRISNVSVFNLFYCPPPKANESMNVNTQHFYLIKHFVTFSSPPLSTHCFLFSNCYQLTHIHSILFSYSAPSFFLVRCFLHFHLIS